MKHDFYKIVVTPTKRGNSEISADYLVRPSKDLMIRGGQFYAILNKETGLWSTNLYDLQQWIDEELYSYKERAQKSYDGTVSVKSLSSYKSRSWNECLNYLRSLPDNYNQLDEKITFSNTKIEPKDYISKMLPYPLEEGDYSAWDEIVGTLYSPEEREKIEWCIGAVVSGDSRDIQKFLVFNGDPGAGKGTILKIIRKLFDGYCVSFNAKALTQSNKSFTMEAFRSNPLVAIQEDGDLSKIEDNTKLNSIVSHETMEMEEKFVKSYEITPKAFLFVASNKPVKITDAKSGIIRRLIDVRPIGAHIERRRYDQLMSQIDFELSGIAWHCLQVYKKLGKKNYDGYVPTEMIYQTDPFFNFIEYNYDIFADEDGVTLKNAYKMWKEYCDNTGVNSGLYKMYEMREQLKSYFKEFDDVARINGEQVRSYYSGFIRDKIKKGVSPKKPQNDMPVKEEEISLVLDQQKSILDEELADCVAQYGEVADGKNKPVKRWDRVTTKLKDLDTKKLHFILLPENHIVIDLDLKDENGNKDKKRNLEAAAKWPKTYAEFSQGGNGVHLHYIYTGDPSELESLYAKDIEIKVYSGKSSLRRRLSWCNNEPIATLNCGLPRKERGKSIDFDAVKDEKHLRSIILKCLKKDIEQPYTAPAMSLIKKVTDDAYASGLNYSITDLRPVIIAFAEKSHHQKETCKKMALDIHYTGKGFENEHEVIKTIASKVEPEFVVKESTPLTKEQKTLTKKEDSDLVFYDIEVYPNLLLICWKEAGKDAVHHLVNPTKIEIEKLMEMKLVGFNCRRYDNHIIYARYLGYNNEQLYRLSQRIVGGSTNAMFGNAYDISYTDVYDFAAKKQSLKKWEIELGIHHQEMGIPWDQPVPEEKWKEVIGYCENDVRATEAVFNRLSGDFQARKILAEIAGMNVNSTTNQLTTRIIFGDVADPQKSFVYPDLKKKFPGYRFENGKSYYRHKIKFSKDFEESFARIRKLYSEEQIIQVNPKEKWVEVDEEIGEGGRVYAVPGIYRNVVTYDVASMHPSSIIAENGFGPFTERFKNLLDIRIAIKHKDYETAGSMLDGKLKKYLTNKDQAKALSQALKIAINSVYGLTAAGFENKFRDPRNVDNWVAKRGALFMEQLRLAVQEMGGTVVHIKTDSIKVENPSEEITNYILSKGKEWGYNFEVEDVYERICLVNDAVYIARRDKKDPGWIEECEKAKKRADENKSVYVEPTRWTATGAQFQHPYVFKHLFSHEPIEFNDLCETKTVTSALYLDLNEKMSDVSEYEKERDKIASKLKKLKKVLDDPKETQQNKLIAETESAISVQEIERLNAVIDQGHNYVFIGKAGSFCPIKSGFGGGILCREKDGKFYAATGSKGYRWQEGERIRQANKMEVIDMNYFESLADDAKAAIEVYGPFDIFISEEPEPAPTEPKQRHILSEKDIQMMAEAAEKKYGDANRPPWAPPCGKTEYTYCSECPEFCENGQEPFCNLGYNLSDYLWSQEDNNNEQPANAPCVA